LHPIAEVDNGIIGNWNNFSSFYLNVKRALTLHEVVLDFPGLETREYGRRDPSR
jgi:hypothetical protein